MLKKIAFTLVLLMVFLQTFYALFAFIDPLAFSNIRRTKLVSIEDRDWVVIYASRTLFIALIIGLLLFYKQYQLLIGAALIGIIMPATDGWLAYQAGATLGVIVKHVMTIFYLLITAVVLYFVVTKESSEQKLSL